MGNDSVKLEIIVDEKNGTLIVKNFRAGLAGIPKEAEGAESAIGKLWKGMALGDLVASGIKTSYSAFVGILKSSATEYMQAEAGNAALRQTLVNLGDATEGTFNQLDAYAEKIQATTVVDDDMAKSLMQLGLNMGIPIKQIGGATEAAIGLTKAFKGMSLDTAMKATAAAFEGNTQKLQRYIPELKETATQSEKLAIVQKAMADGLKIAHNEITTGQGKLAQFKNDWGDLQKVIGKVLVEAVMPLIGGFRDFFNQNKNQIVGFVQSLVEGFTRVVGIIKIVIGALGDMLAFIDKMTPFMRIVQTIIEGLEKIGILVNKELSTAYDKLGESIDREAEMQKKSIDRFRESAKAVGATKDEIHQLVLKYKDSESAGIMHERMLRELIKTHPELKEKLYEHAGQMAKNTGAVKDFTLGLHNETKAVKDLAAAERDKAKAEELKAKNMAAEAKALDDIFEGHRVIIPEIEGTADANYSVAEATEKYTQKLIDSKKATSNWYDGVQDLNAALADLGINLDSLIPGLGSLFTSGMKAFESLKKLEEAGKSATFGQYASAIGAVVGAIAAMANAADAYNKKQAQEFIKNMEKGIEISTEMAEKIRLLGEEYKGLHGYVDGVWQEPGWEEFHAATSEALNELIDETKMSADAFDDWALRVHQILSDFDSGLMDTAEASAEFGDAFESLMNQAIKLGTEGSASVIAMFDDLISRGMKVAEVTKYIDEQMAAGLEGYKKMQEATKASADALAAFGGLGIKVFDDMIAYEKKVADNQGLVDGINGATAAMIGLSNSQKLSESQFDDFAVAGSTAYQKLIDGGMTSAEALKTMGPYLQRLQFLHEQYGYTIDDATQAMIDQGIASGIVVENQKTEQQMMIDLLQKMVDILSNGLPAAFATTGTAAAVAFGRAAAAAQMVYDIMNNINNGNPGTETEPGASWKYKGYAPDVYAASGFYSSALPTDMLIQAHKGEPVGIGMAAIGAFFSPRSGSDASEEASITPAGGGYSSPRSGSDSKTTVIVEDHSVWHIQVDPKSGIDQNALCEALNIVVKDNRQQVTDKIVAAVARKL